MLRTTSTSQTTAQTVTTTPVGFSIFAPTMYCTIEGTSISLTTPIHGNDLPYTPYSTHMLPQLPPTVMPSPRATDTVDPMHELFIDNPLIDDPFAEPTGNIQGVAPISPSEEAFGIWELSPQEDWIVADPAIIVEAVQPITQPITSFSTSIPKASSADTETPAATATPSLKPIIKGSLARSRLFKSKPTSMPTTPIDTDTIDKDEITSLTPNEKTSIIIKAGAKSAKALLDYLSINMSKLTTDFNFTREQIITLASHREGLEIIHLIQKNITLLRELGYSSQNILKLAKHGLSSLSLVLSENAKSQKRKLEDNHTFSSTPPRAKKTTQAAAAIPEELDDDEDHDNILSIISL